MGSPIEHDFSANDVTISSISQPGAEGKSEISVQVGSRTFTVKTTTSRSVADLNADAVFKEKVATMAAAYVTAEDFYKAKGKQKEIKIISTPQETKIKYGDKEKSLSNFVEKKQANLAKKADASKSEVNANAASLINQLSQINLKLNTVSAKPRLAPGAIELQPAPAAASAKNGVSFDQCKMPEGWKKKNRVEKQSMFKNVYTVTQQACEHGYVNKNDKHIKLDQPKAVKISSPKRIPDDKNVHNKKTKFEFANGDTFNEMMKVQDKHPGERVVGLDMANAMIKGGGYRNGKIAQEEDLCRRSNLYNGLKTVTYPFAENEVVSAKVQVFRDDEMKFMDEPKEMILIAVAGLQNRIDAEDQNARPKSLDDQKARTQEIMKVALRGAYDPNDLKPQHLVLGALGCGAFGNPPEVVAECWRNVLNDPEFKGVFQTITFAVKSAPDDPNAVQFKILSDKLEKEDQTPFPNPIKAQQNHVNELIENSFKKFSVAGIPNFCRFIPSDLETMPQTYDLVNTLMYQVFQKASSKKNSRLTLQGKKPEIMNLIGKMAKEYSASRDQQTNDKIIVDYTNKMFKLLTR